MSEAEGLDAEGLDVSAAVFERAAEVFGLLSTAPRLRILKALCEQERSVSQLMNLMGVTQPSMSQQLNLLYRSGLVARRREGAQVFYRADPASGAFICKAVKSLLCDSSPCVGIQ